jgi:glycosyltransferase involved in cell wall biosynthesis
MKQKLFRITTVPSSLEGLLKGQLSFLNQYYNVTGIADKKEAKSWKIIAEREKIRCYPVSLKREISLLKDICSLLVLYKFFKKEKPDIVHSITPKAGLLSMVAAKMAGVPIRIHTFTGLIFPYKAGNFQKILILMDKILCACATNIYPEGRGVLNDLQKFKITDKPLKVIANGNINGIDTHHFNRDLFSLKQRKELKENLRIAETDFVFIFIGRLVKDKGINELIKIFTEINHLYPHTKLLLVGRFERKLDPLFSETENIMHNHPDILQVGEQPDVRPYLAISDIFVFPSYREGFPNVVMEAGAMELPCIVTDINGCNEIIEDGVNGLIIPSKDKESLKEKMLLLLNNSDLRIQLKQKSREMITSRYEQNVLWEALLEEYKNLTDNVQKLH